MMLRQEEGARLRAIMLAAVISLSLTAMVTDSAAQSAPHLSDAGPLLDVISKHAQDRSQPEADRLKMIEALGQWGTEQVRAPLLALLGDPLPSIRVAAARALGWPGNREAVAALRQRAESPAEIPAVRAAALDALGRIGDDSARPLLLSASRDPDVNIREAALRGVTLGGLVSPADRRPLLRQVAGDRDLDLLLRCQAIQALAELKDEESADLLARLLEHEAPYPMPALSASPTQVQVMMMRYREVRDVRAWAARALAVLASRSALPLLLKTAEEPDDFFLRTMSIGTLGFWKAREALPVLLRRLDDPFEHARAAALRALAEIGDPSVVDAVLLRLSDGVPMVRAQAAYALGLLGDPKVRPQLERLQEHESNPDVQQALAAALARLSR
jgi:HEAT repeat protein